jgi:uncharacterized Fe-S radical SAM superfamily protein PflX
MYLCLLLDRMSLLSVIQKYLNIIKQNIVLMRQLYEPKPISCCHNYILSFNSHFRILKEPTSTIRHPELKNARLPALY